MGFPGVPLGSTDREANDEGIVDGAREDVIAKTWSKDCNYLALNDRITEETRYLNPKK